jgi:hypothetical protein
LGKNSHGEEASVSVGRRFGITVLSGYDGGLELGITTFIVIIQAAEVKDSVGRKEGPLFIYNLDSGPLLNRPVCCVPLIAVCEVS